MNGNFKGNTALERDGIVVTNIEDWNEIIRDKVAWYNVGTPETRRQQICQERKRVKESESERERERYWIRLPEPRN